MGSFYKVQKDSEVFRGSRSFRGSKGCYRNLWISAVAENCRCKNILVLAAVLSQTGNGLQIAVATFGTSETSETSGTFFPSPTSQNKPIFPLRRPKIFTWLHCQKSYLAGQYLI
ncbi:MAG: hypothetical protein DI535_13260 [Citrobacter freundii]|nr:MAG: hypothetical protein DI535_13260 [Citrobacter freundii]